MEVNWGLNSYQRNINQIRLEKANENIEQYMKSNQLDTLEISGAITEVESTVSNDNAGNDTLTARQKEIQRIQEQMAEIRQSNDVNALDIKLKCGGNLTKKEMDYLKEKNPELYQQAVEIKQERELYQKSLKSCRTKEDVQRLQTGTLQQFVSEMKAVKRNPNISEGEKLSQLEQISRRCFAIMNDYSSFLSSSDYRSKPTDQEYWSKQNKTTTYGTTYPNAALFKFVMKQCEAELGDMYIGKIQEYNPFGQLDKKV